MNNQDISLMKPFMPPFEDFKIYLDKIWGSSQLSNNGPIHEEFENALCDYLSVKYICLVANGTLGLMLALKSLKLNGEVITTPFTYAATAQAIYWNNLTPVFVDINENDLNIDISNIEKAITPKTSAILPVHIFGNPCKIEQIDKLAKKYSLKVIYDAAHCFGVDLNGDSICNFGDLSVISFHATKVFNSFEGGAIICHDEKTKKNLDALKNNGFDFEHKLIGHGFNAKMNEMQAAFGLVQLKYVDKVIANRKAASLKYRELLKNVNGLKILNEIELVKHNYSYFPVIINPEEFGATRDNVCIYLAKRNISTRKYFYPLISDFTEFSKYKTNELPISERIADNIICLPLFHGIALNEISYVAETLKQVPIKEKELI